MISPFSVSDMDAARAIILTPEGWSSEDRWARETPYLGGLIAERTELGRVLDYGCGVGRMAKELLDRGATEVVGVDASPAMRGLAKEYLPDDRFRVCGEAGAVGDGEFDTALAIWALQHFGDVVAVVARLKAALRPGGRLFVVNNLGRAVTASDGRWVDDGINVFSLVTAVFRPVAWGQLDPAHVGSRIADHAWWGVFDR